MSGFWLCLISIILYAIGTFLEHLAKMIHGKNDEDDEDEN